MASPPNDHRPNDLRRAPAAERNRVPILEVLRRVLPADAFILEIASGTGEHAAWMAPQLDGVTWQPSDSDAELRASITARTREDGAGSVLPPLAVDAHDADWTVTRKLDAVFCANMIHIAPWSACEGLMAGAGRHLAAGGLLILYGPFQRGGRHTAPSNAEFDANLKRQNPEWGVRELERVAEAARTNGLELSEIIDMPANNLTLIFRKPC
ncbi:MAG: DUF938 domain-containing protein [Alphaproteobacteria bacterium]